MKHARLFLLITLFGILAGCNGNRAEGISTDEETITSTVDVKKIVSAGVGINFNNITGGTIEMVINPTTHLPAVLYYDRSLQIVPGGPAGALKYAYMDITGTWNIEVIDGNYGTGACGTATAFCVGAQNVTATTFPQVYDIEFVPAIGSAEAYPIVVYAHGNNAATGKRVRVASRDAETGLWSIENAVQTSSIPSGIAVATIEYPIKGLNITIDSAGRPHVYFALYETTLINSRIKYTMKTGGAWTTLTNVAPTGFNLVSGPPAIALGTGVTQAEAVTCPLNDFAILSYPATDIAPSANSNQPWIIRCTAVNASGTCTTWSGLDMITGCGGLCLTGTAMTAAGTNAAARSTLAIDSTNNKVIYGMFSTLLPVTQTVTGIQGSTDDCSTFTTTAWATQAYPTANQGINGLRLTTSLANTVNASTPQALMLSTTAAGGATHLHKTNLSPFTATWTTGNTVNVETATASLAGALKFDDTTFIAWGAYAVTTGGASGALGNDIKVFSAYESDISSTGYVSHTFVDQTLGIFPSTAVPVLDAAIADNGTVGYAYFFTELGTAGPNSHLYYGIKGGSNVSPAFGEKLVYNSTQGLTTLLIGQQPSLAYDSTSNPVIAFQDTSVAGQGLLMLARSSNQGVSFSAERVDGATTGNNVGTFTSVAVRSNNTVGISYYDSTNANLKFAKKSATGAWKRFAVDGPTGSCATGTAAGAYSRLKWTASGKPVIVYQSTISGVKYLRMAIGTPDANALVYTWSCLTLDSTGQAANARGEGIDFTFDSEEKPIIVHQDSTAARVRYVTCGDSVETCFTNGASAFTGEIVESVGSMVANSSRPAVTVDSHDKIFIAYYSAADLGLYVKSRAADVTTSFQFISAETIETPVSGIIFTNPAGQYARILTNSSNQPMLFYRSYENWLKFFSRENN